MLYGSARITAVDQDNRKFVADVKEGDLWFFPSGIPHSIQGLVPDGCEFLLAFDDGAFSEDSTFLITDWFAHTPKDVLARNFGTPETRFDKIPQKELYIFNARMPGSLADDLNQSSQSVVPEPYSFALLDQPPIRTKGGTVRIADSSNFKARRPLRPRWSRSNLVECASYTGIRTLTNGNTTLAARLACPSSPVVAMPTRSILPPVTLDMSREPLATTSRTLAQSNYASWKSSQVITTLTSPCADGWQTRRRNW